MSETTTETKSPETPAVTTEAPAQTWQKPPGYDPVDLDALGVTPEAKGAIEARIRHLYSQAKAGTEAKREARELREHLEKLTPVVEQLAARDTARTKETIETEIVRARDEGRVRDELKLQQELTAISTPKVEAPKEKKVEPEVYVEAAQGWATETNADGTLKRPWIQEDHPDNVMALGHLHRIRDEWTRKGWEINPQTMPILLTEIDQRMSSRTQPRQTTTAVLPTSQVRPQAKTDEITLTQDQKYVAERLYGHIKEPAKRHEAYANALKIQGMSR